MKIQHKIRHIRLCVQLVVGLFFLNMTAVGAYIVAPLLPVIRFDYPGTPGTIIGGQRVCDIGIIYRALTQFWPLAFLIIAVAMLILVCIIVGRGLCGWLCPIGLFQDLLTKLRVFLRINKKEFSQSIHEKLVLVKYAIFVLALLLAASIGLSFIASQSAGITYKSIYPEGTTQVAPFCTICPAPDIYYIGTVINTHDFYFSDPTRYFALTVIIIVFAGSFMIPRFWCRYFCPVGATSSFFNKVSIISIRKKHADCVRCYYCTNACSMRIRKVCEEYEKDRVVDMNCTLCLECIEVCPENALSLSVFTKQVYQGRKKR